jgi:hypothetical protein
MGKHSRPAPGAARTAGAVLARGLPFWTGSVTLAAVVGLCASSLLAPGRPGQPDAQAVATRQVAAHGSTTSDEPTTAGATTSASPPTTTSGPPTSSSSQPTTSVPSTTSAIPSATSTTAAETASALSTAAASSPADSPSATAGPFDPGPIAAPSGLQSTPSTAVKRSRPVGASPSDTTDRRRRDDDRRQPVAGPGQAEPVVAVAARRFASVLTDDRPGAAFLTLRSTASSGDGQPGDLSSSDADDIAEAVAPPTPSQSSAERRSDAEAADQAPPDAADVHLHIDPTPMQVAVFLAVFLLGLAAALVGTSTGSTGAHRRR